MTTTRKGIFGIPTMEVALIVGVIGVLGAVFAWQLLYYWELAERTSMELTLSNMRSALRMELARRTVAPKGRYAQLPGTNPMLLLQQAPANYLGERDDVDLEEIPSGHWVYSRKQRALYYLPNYRHHLEGPEGADDEKLVFLKFVLESKQGSTEILGDTDIDQEVRLVSRPPYKWF